MIKTPFRFVSHFIIFSYIQINGISKGKITSFEKDRLGKSEAVNGGGDTPLIPVQMRRYKADNTYLFRQ